MEWGEWKTEWGKNAAQRRKDVGLWKTVGVSPFHVEKNLLQDNEKTGFPPSTCPTVTYY